MPNSGRTEEWQSLEARLDEKFKPYFMRLEKTLNRNSLGYGPLQPGNLIHVAQIQSYGGGVTRIPHDEDAFNLNAPRAGQIRDVQITNADKNRFLIRRVWGYSAVLRAVESSVEDAERSIRWMVEEMLLTLRREAGFGADTIHHGTYARFQRPGYPGTYFLETGESAGVELRLYSDTYPAVSPTLIHYPGTAVAEAFQVPNGVTGVTGTVIAGGGRPGEIVSQVSNEAGSYRLSFDTATGVLSMTDE